MSSYESNLAASEVTGRGCNLLSGAHALIARQEVLCCSAQERIESMHWRENVSAVYKPFVVIICNDLTRELLDPYLWLEILVNRG